MQYMNEMLKFLAGEWIDTDIVCKQLGITFQQGLQMFEFSRTAEWESMIGQSEEERNRNGQRITTKFRIRQKSE